MNEHGGDHRADHSGDHDGDQVRRRIDPDPYPSGIYSILPYPSVAESAVSSSGAAPTSAGSTSAGSTSAGSTGAGSTRSELVGRGADDAVFRIGDIEVTGSALRTPAGDFPLAGVTMEVIEVRTVRVPTWAVFCAIVGFFVVPVASLAFLLAREEVAAGPVRVMVTGRTVDGVAANHEAVAVDPAEIELARSLAAS